MRFVQDQRTGLLLPNRRVQRGFFAMGPAFFRKPSSGGGGTPTLVSRVHTTPCDPGFSSGPYVSGSFDAVLGNLIAVLAAQDDYGTRPITGCTDTAGNTYTKASYVATTGTRAIICYYCLSSAAKTGNVVSLAAGSSLKEKGSAVLQFSGGTWTYAGGAGYTAGAYNGSATTGTLNMTGKGVVLEFGTGDEDQTTSTWNFSAGCSDFYGSASTPDDTNEGSGLVGVDFLSSASASHTFTATFANTHSLLGQWGFLLS
jgi:hypothetical protein